MKTSQKEPGSLESHADCPAKYRVTWEIDVEAGSPLEAAEKALLIQREPVSNANTFEVFDKTGGGTRIHFEERRRKQEERRKNTR